MDVDIEQVRHLARKIKAIIYDIDLRFVDFCGFPEWSCGLVSAQSVLDQINALVEGEYGLQKLVSWHIEEGMCVSEALELQCNIICFTDNEIRRSFEEVFNSNAYRGVPRDYRSPDPAKHSHSFSFPDMPGGTFPSHGIPIVEEPLGKSIDWLVMEFSRFSTAGFYDEVSAWGKVGGMLEETARYIFQVASSIQSAGSHDAFTSAACTGIRRWATSIDDLSEQVKVVWHRLDEFMGTVFSTSTLLNYIANDSDRAKAAATPQNPYNPAPYNQEANELLKTSYNPGLVIFDTRDIEFPVPQRALRGDYDPTPRHTPSTPNYSGSFTTPPHISAHPHLSTPSPSRPMVVPPSGGGIGDVTPPHGMAPAPTDPNRVTPPAPGGGSTTPTSPTSPLTPNTPGAGGAGGGVSPAPYQPPVGTMPGVGNTGAPGRSPSQGGNDTSGQRSGNNTIIIGGVAPGGASGSSEGKRSGTTPKPGSTLKPGLGSGTTTPTTPPGGAGRTPGMAPHAPGFGGKGAAGITPTLPPTHTGTPTTTPGAGNTPSAHQPGTGHPIVPIVPTPPAVPTTGENPQQKRHRAPRSAENTENILQQPTNLPRGIIRHPDDPLYGTGR